jgi:hypothetical protein
MRPQTVTADIFERLVQLHPNPIVTADDTHQYLIVGEREYKTELQVHA